MAESTAIVSHNDRARRSHKIPRRRMTVWAAIYFAAYVAIPVLVLCLAGDVALAMLFRHLGLGCFGFWCWLV